MSDEVKIKVIAFDVVLPDGSEAVWEVHTRPGGAVQIVDERGRCRHTADRHEYTATVLAHRLAQDELPDAANLTAALRRLAKMFASRHPRPG